jgi:hypothetical protein
MKPISIATNEAGVFVYLDRTIVTEETIQQTLEELSVHLHGVAQSTEPDIQLSASAPKPKKPQDLTFLLHLPEVAISDELIEQYKNSTFSRQEIYDDAERDERLYGGAK